MRVEDDGRGGERLLSAISRCVKLYGLAGEALAGGRKSMAYSYLLKAFRLLRSALMKYGDDIETARRVYELYTALRSSDATNVDELYRYRNELLRLIEDAVFYGVSFNELSRGVHVLPVGGYVDRIVKRFAEAFYEAEKELAEAGLAAEDEHRDVLVYVVGGKAFLKIGADCRDVVSVFFDRQRGGYVARYHSPVGADGLLKLTHWEGYYVVEDDSGRKYDFMFRAEDVEKAARAFAASTTDTFGRALVAEAFGDAERAQALFKTLRGFVNAVQKYADPH
ncbi:MAG: hypothetical protein ACPL4I_12285 [Bacteroidota bacterium]